MTDKCRQARLDAELCPRCGGSRDRETKYCSTCLKKQAERFRRNKERGELTGTCVICGRERKPGARRCQRCLDSLWRGRKKYLQTEAGKKNERRIYERKKKKALESGSCICGGTLTDGFKLCQQCRSFSSRVYKPVARWIFRRDILAAVKKERRLTLVEIGDVAGVSGLNGELVCRWLSGRVKPRRLHAELLGAWLGVILVEEEK